MYQLLIINGIALFGSLFYSYTINKFTKSRLLLFLPSILGIIWFVYGFINYKMNPPEGFAALEIYIIGMIVISVLIGNFIFSLVLMYRNKVNKDKNN